MPNLIPDLVFQSCIACGTSSNTCPLRCPYDSPKSRPELQTVLVEKTNAFYWFETLNFDSLICKQRLYSPFRRQPLAIMDYFLRRLLIFEWLLLFLLFHKLIEKCIEMVSYERKQSLRNELSMSCALNVKNNSSGLWNCWCISLNLKNQKLILKLFLAAMKQNLFIKTLRD